MQQYMHMHAAADAAVAAVVATSATRNRNASTPHFVHIAGTQITLMWFLTLLRLILFIIVELNHVFVYDSLLFQQKFSYYMYMLYLRIRFTD